MQGTLWKDLKREKKIFEVTRRRDLLPKLAWVAVQTEGEERCETFSQKKRHQGGARILAR